MNNTCDKTSNNKFMNCPPRMDDARHFTDYRPADLVMHMAQYDNGVMNSYDYRQWMTHNASKIMEANRHYAYKKNGCGDCSAEGIPVHEICQYNRDHPSCNVANPSGMGLENRGGEPAPANYDTQMGVDSHQPVPLNSVFPLMNRTV